MDSSQRQYGEARLRDQIVQPAATLQGLLGDVRSFMAGHPTSDDLTVVMIET
jgi:serine phosphatase RsbU (regulator of sigma subunit)